MDHDDARVPLLPTSHKLTVATVTTPINMRFAIIFLSLTLPRLHSGLPTENVLQREVQALHTLITDLQIDQRELRQSSNDHTLVDWLKETVVDIRQEMNEWIVKSQNDMKQLRASLTSEFEHRMENEMKEAKLQIRNLEVQQAKHEATIEKCEIDPKVKLLTVFCKIILRFICFQMCNSSKGPAHHVKILTKEVEYLQSEMHRLKRKIVSKRFKSQRKPLE